HVVNGSDVTDVPDAIRSLTGGLGVDYAFEVIGVPAVITQALLSPKSRRKAGVVRGAPLPEKGATPPAQPPPEEETAIRAPPRPPCCRWRKSRSSARSQARRTSAATCPN